MTQTASAEHARWANPDPDDLFGHPHYDVEPVVDFLATRRSTMCSRVLDVGCGPGRLLDAYLTRFPHDEGLGIDVSPCSYATAMDEVAAKHRSCDFLIGNGRILPVMFDESDLIWSVTVLQHMPHVAQISYIEQMYSCLAQDGAMVLTVAVADDEPAPFFFPWSTDGSQLSFGQLVEWLNERFYLVEIDGEWGRHQWTWITIRR